MEVNRISANIRYSQDTGHGAWKVIELGAEATVSDAISRERWGEEKETPAGEAGAPWPLGRCGNWKVV